LESLASTVKMLYFLLYRIGVFISLVLPVKIAYRIADIFGRFYYLLARRDRKIVTNNLKVILNRTGNTPEVQYASRMVFTNFARYLVEFFRTPKIDLKYIEEYVEIRGRENLDKALSLGRGVLLVSAHLGNWELGAIVLSILGYPVNVVAWTHRNRLINDFFLQQRQSKGVKIIPLGTAIRKVFSALKNNEAVGFLGDIDYADPQTGITVKLFGRDTIMPKGPAAFSLKAGSPIIPLFMLREKGNKFRFIFEEPIMYNATGNREEDLTSLTQILTKTIESYIARNPGQWFMLTPRWQSAQTVGAVDGTVGAVDARTDR